MTITITAFERSPDGGKGLARDTRVRWALEEAGQPYQVRLVSFRAMKEPAHRALHPFGQIPTYEEGDLVLFETGAIVFHVAERYPGLLPTQADAGRALSPGYLRRLTPSSRPFWSWGPQGCWRVTDPGTRSGCPGGARARAAAPARCSPR
jgi:hypothetical protein